MSSDVSAADNGKYRHDADASGGGSRRPAGAVRYCGAPGGPAGRRSEGSSRFTTTTVLSSSATAPVDHSFTAPRIRRAPPQRSHTSTRIANTRRRNRAQGHRPGDRAPASGLAKAGNSLEPEYGPAQVEPQATLASRQWAKCFLGWMPEIALEEGIKMMIAQEMAALMSAKGVEA